MKIGIVGASGRTGIAVIEAAARAGHEPVAIVRDPARLTVPVFETRVADALSPAELAKAFAGLDAVAWCVGPGRDTAKDVMATSIAATISAMDHADVRRLVATSASGPFTDGDSGFTRAIVKPILWRFFGDAWRDIRATEPIIRASDTDWTIMRPPMLQDGPAKGYRSRRDLNERRFTIRRADLGQAMVDMLADDSTIGHVVSVAN